MYGKWRDIIEIKKENHHGMDLYFPMWKEYKFQVEGCGGFVSEYQAEYWLDDNEEMLVAKHNEWMDFIILRGSLE